VQARIAPSVQIEAEIERLLLDGPEGGGDVDQLDRLAELGRLGAQLVLQRAIEEELERFLHRTRYERTPAATGSRNGHRPRQVQTAEGPLTIAVPQVRGTLARFVNSVIPDTRAIVRTRPVEALVIGAYVRGLSVRDIEALAAEAGLGHLSKSAVSDVCRELRDRYRTFRAKSLAAVTLLSLMLDAIYLPTRPEGPREGVLVAWGYTLDGERILLDVCLGQRERAEDWLDLGRGLGLSRSERTAIAAIAAARSIPAGEQVA
jgi:transposase-like protein